MEQRHPVAEISGEPGHHLGGQGDLRHQDHHGLPLGQQLLGQADVDQRFAASCDALQQRDAALCGLGAAQNVRIRSLLLVVQSDGFCLYSGDLIGDPIGLLGAQRHDATFFQGGHGLAGDAGEIAQLVDGGLALLQEELHRVVHAGRAFLLGFGPGGGILRREGQLHQLHGLVLYIAAAHRLAGDHPLLFQTPQNGGGTFAKGVPQR